MILTENIKKCEVLLSFEVYWLLLELVFEIGYLERILSVA